MLLLAGCDNDHQDRTTRYDQRIYTEKSDSNGISPEQSSVYDEHQVTQEQTEQHEPPIVISPLLSFFLSWGFYIGYYALSIVVSTFVYRDAKKRKNLALNIGPFWWAVITVLEAPLGVLAYWVMHYSSIAKKLNESE